MTTSTNYSLKVLTTGFMVLVFFCIPLFWPRCLCTFGLQIGLPQEARYVCVTPSGLLTDAEEDDPNADRKSRASGHMDGDALVDTLGLFDYVIAKLPGGRRSDVLAYEQDKAWMYFDRAMGQLVFRDTYQEQKGDRSVTRLTIPHYAGPKGISTLPAEDLGRFGDPLVVWWRRSCIVYDKGVRRFFAIERETMTVREGPEPNATVSCEPVCIGSSDRRHGLDLHWRPTMRRVMHEDQSDSRRGYVWQNNMSFNFWDSRHVPVVNASGRIDLLDCQTLELTTGKGHLPAPKTLLGEGMDTPRQLLGYEVVPVHIASETQRYLGMVVGSVSRQGTSMALAVFDAAGKRVRTGHSQAVAYSRKASVVANALEELAREGTVEVDNLAYPSIPSAQAAMNDVPQGQVLALFLYGLENLHPLGLTMASFCLVHHIDAGAGHRALFLMPNSLAAMHRDVVGFGVTAQFFRALVAMLPAVSLAVFLAWRVVRDAKIVGLSSNARLSWVLLTLGFGLPAYITYRLTRPKAALVTCPNCGLPRRPDMDRCHRCNGPWRVPELNPPAWRVLDGGHRDRDESPPVSEESPGE